MRWHDVANSQREIIDGMPGHQIKGKLQITLKGGEALFIARVRRAR